MAPSIHFGWWEDSRGQRERPLELFLSFETQQQGAGLSGQTGLWGCPAATGHISEAVWLSVHHRASRALA